MLKEICGIELCGANFENPTRLNMFNPIDGGTQKTIKGTLLYGRNGSGKSTIARGFRKIIGEKDQPINYASVLDKNGSPIVLTESEKKKIFIFDEDYVDKNVKLQEDHLDTIVMLGKQADLTEQIAKAEIDCEIARSEADKQQKIYVAYQDHTNEKSPKYYINQLRFALQGDDNWAGRDKVVRNGRQNSPVRDDTYEQFLRAKPTKSRDELVVDFANGVNELKTAREGRTNINPPAPNIPDDFSMYDDTEVRNNLFKKIERPILSDRERYLLQLVQRGKSPDLIAQKAHLEREDTSFCPYCFQKLTAEYKSDLIQSIERVLSNVVKEHQQSLRDMMHGEMSIDLSPFAALKGYGQCVDLVREIDSAVHANNDLLQGKIDNPYEVPEGDLTEIQPLMNQLGEALVDLEKERLEYNCLTKRTEPIITKLNQINSQIAYYDVQKLAAQYKTQATECDEAKRRYEQAQTVLIEKQTVVRDLEAKRKNLTLALDVINNAMKYIFFAEDRLKIEYDNSTYKLKSHRHSVKPCDISVGERNIMGLCYFFASIMEGQEENAAYTAENILIIDDPVSSFDIENRVGILSFLKYKLSLFLEGNEASKAVIMTHDLMTFYDVHKIFEEIVAKCKAKGYALTPKFNEFELRMQMLEPFQYKKRQEYTEMMRIMYTYGQNRATDQEMVIGNIMRQVLEAFSTFEYKQGIQAVSTDEKILGLIGNRKYQAYFRNLMYRLVLNGGSHKEEQVRAMSDLNFFSHISDTEKRRTARDILCFIYLLNKQHLLAHLAEVDPTASNVLDVWCEEIEARAAVI